MPLRKGEGCLLTLPCYILVLGAVKIQPYQVVGGEEAQDVSGAGASSSSSSKGKGGAKIIQSFDEDLRDCVVYSSLILSHIPELQVYYSIVPLLCCSPCSLPHLHHHQDDDHINNLSTRPFDWCLLVSFDLFLFVFFACVCWCPSLVYFGVLLLCLLVSFAAAARLSGA